MIKELNNFSSQIHSDNKKKGFWDHPIERGTRLMLVVSELGEAVEADRKGKHADINSFEKWKKVLGYDEAFTKFVKDTYEDEIADAIIRLLDLAGGENIDIGKHVEYKLTYNKRRGHKHGKKY